MNSPKSKLHHKHDHSHPSGRESPEDAGMENQLMIHYHRHVERSAEVRTHTIKDLMETMENADLELLQKWADAFQLYDVDHSGVWRSGDVSVCLRMIGGNFLFWTNDQVF